MGSTAVRFYTGLGDRLGFAARLLRKAGRQGLQAEVLGPEPVLVHLSRQLWSLPGFQAHALPGAAEAQRQRSSIVLSTDVQSSAGRPLLLNLLGILPANLERWPQVVELITDEPEDVLRGRRLYKAYVALGLQPEHLAAGAA
jgi:DNA polymerase-3 subunit chi